jgi:GT2 family glycosyltransferase
VRSGVVTVTYNSRSEVADCLEAVLPQARASSAVVVVMDNGSHDGTTELVLDQFPDVHVLRGDNLGFGAAINRVVFDPIYADVQSWLLLNPDCVVESNDLLPKLQALLDEKKDVGSAAALVLFKERTFEIAFRFEPTASVSMSEDRLRVGGAKLHSADGELGVSEVQLITGDLGWLTPNPVGLNILEWTVPEDIVRVELWVESQVAGGIQFVDQMGHDVGSVVAINTAGWINVPQNCFTNRSHINNAGSFVFEGGGGDRMFRADYQPDLFDGPFEAQAWSGCCVLVRTEYFKRLGGFSSRYFMYYEDVDLSLRGAAAGYRYLVHPEAIARHSHSASSGGDESQTREHFVQQSRGAFLARHGAAKALGRETLVLSIPVLTNTARAVRSARKNRQTGAQFAKTAQSKAVILLRFVQGSRTGGFDRFRRR